MCSAKSESYELIADDFLELFEFQGVPGVEVEGVLKFGQAQVPIRNGIPRFTPDEAYTDNFSLLRERHAHLQLDSVNGTTDRRDTLLRRTNWPEEFFKGKLILECGCGAGPDTEILLALGARVLSVDLSGVDVAQRNLGAGKAVQLVQASIANLPLKQGAFDVVFCHRVLQHTEQPLQTLKHILRFVKPGGAAFVHSYSNSWFQRLRWKYLLLPFTRKLSPQTLYKRIEAYAGPAFVLTNWLSKTRLGRRIAWHFIPFLNYRRAPKFRTMTDEQIIEYAVHDTFDALSPRFDKPTSVADLRRIGEDLLREPFEVVDDKTVSLLRTIVN